MSAEASTAARYLLLINDAVVIDGSEDGTEASNEAGATVGAGFILGNLSVIFIDFVVFVVCIVFCFLEYRFSVVAEAADDVIAVEAVPADVATLLGNSFVRAEPLAKILFLRGVVAEAADDVVGAEAVPSDVAAGVFLGERFVGVEALTTSYHRKHVTACISTLAHSPCTPRRHMMHLCLPWTGHNLSAKSHFSRGAYHLKNDCGANSVFGN